MMIEKWPHFLIVCYQKWSLEGAKATRNDISTTYREYTPYLLEVLWGQQFKLIHNVFNELWASWKGRVTWNPFSLSWRNTHISLRFLCLLMKPWVCNHFFVLLHGTKNIRVYFLQNFSLPSYVIIFILECWIFVESLFVND